MMWTMLTQPEAFPFALALIVMALLAALEILSLLFGAQLSGLLDGLLPDLDGDADLDLDASADGVHGLSALLVWLRLGELPMLIVLILFLSLFGLIGVGLQTAAAQGLGEPLGIGAAVIITLIASILPLRWVIGGLARVLPGDETEAMSREELIGLSGSIVIGTARRGSPAQAKVRNALGQTHYVMVEPEDDAGEIGPEQALVLKRRTGNVFIAEATMALEDQQTTEEGI